MNMPVTLLYPKLKNITETQEWRMLCKSEGAQASNTRANSYLEGGLGACSPRKNLEFRLSENASEAF